MSVDALFEELVSRWTSEEPLSVDELLERAGPNAEELARLIDAFLERAPRRTPTPDARAAVEALAARIEHEPPLLSARLRARRRVSEVVAAILSAGRLPASAEALVQSYYQRLEGGLLDPHSVSETVWAALGSVLGSDAQRLAQLGFQPPAPASVALTFHRTASPEFRASGKPVDESGGPSVDVRRKVELLFTGVAAD
jgi:AcrR family transcriptional regulator